MERIPSSGTRRSVAHGLVEEVVHILEKESTAINRIFRRRFVHPSRVVLDRAAKLESPVAE
jgi:hypothetical protein